MSKETYIFTNKITGQTTINSFLASNMAYPNAIQFCEKLGEDWDFEELED
tara:strand:+ start:128 stop:277 length:150 start_codon:yes stop_codon:yes gene_type:complete